MHSQWGDIDPRVQKLFLGDDKILTFFMYKIQIYTPTHTESLTDI